MTKSMLSIFIKVASERITKQDIPSDYFIVKQAARLKFPNLSKLAWNSGELAGLGTLAAPSAANLSGHPMKEKHKDIAEVVGLGTLATPYIHNIAADKSTRYANSGIGKKLSKIFSH